MLGKAKFGASFAGDVSPLRVAFLESAQMPWGVAALADEVTSASWKIKPSWYLVATDDKMIRLATQRALSKRAGATVLETTGESGWVKARRVRRPGQGGAEQFRFATRGGSAARRCLPRR